MMADSTFSSMFALLEDFKEQWQPRSFNYARLAKIGGDFMLAIALLGLLIAVLIAYPFHEAFGMGTQLFAHLGVLTFATLLKIGYVLRLIGHYELGLKLT